MAAASWPYYNAPVTAPVKPMMPSSGLDMTMVLGGLIAIFMGLYEHHDAVAEMLHRMRRNSWCSLVHHVLVVVVVWSLTAASLTKDEDGNVSPSPHLFMAQAMLAVLFWLQEGLRAAWTRQCSVSKGTLILTTLSLAARLYVHLRCSAYSPTGWSGKLELFGGLLSYYQAAELGTLVIVAGLLAVTELLKWVAPAPQTSMTPICFIVGVLGGLANTDVGLAKSRVLDSLWAMSMYVDCMALLPQLESLAAAPDVRRCALHSSAFLPLLLRRALSLYFWSHAFADLPRDTAFWLYCFEVCSCGILALIFGGQAWKEGPGASGAKRPPAAVHAGDRAAERAAAAGVAPGRGHKEEATLKEMF